ncbi:MAG: hypothetical protein H8E27_15665 [Verrucomicrobia subdivision 3 bacterium]|nr:hypothetical protein [Limisphaerales bacterium]
MNIEILQDCIDTFTLEIIDSGFKRDLDDFISSLPASQNNILPLREIGEKVLLNLDRIYGGDLADSLNVLLTREKSIPFTEAPHNETLRNLVDNIEIQQNEFFNQLAEILNELQRQIQQNIEESVEIFCVSR